MHTKVGKWWCWWWWPEFFVFVFHVHKIFTIFLPTQHFSIIVLNFTIFFLVSGFLSSSSSFDYNIGRHKKNIYDGIEWNFFFLFLVHTPCFLFLLLLLMICRSNFTTSNQTTEKYVLFLVLSLHFFCNGGERGR